LGKKLKITSELRSLVVQKMLNEPQKTNAEIGRELNIGTSTIQCWAAKNHQVQESREKYRQVVRNQLVKDAERHMKNHMTFAEAVGAIRKKASDLEQPVPGKVRIYRALEFVLGRKKAQKLVERRNYERRESKLESVNAWLNGRVRRYPGKIRQINPKCLNLKGISWGVRYLALSTTIIGLTYDLGVKIQGLDLASQIQGVVAKAVDMGRAVRR